MIPQVVVFDLGKVLLEFDYGIMAQKLSVRAKVIPAEIKKLIDHSPLLFRYETGLMTKLEFYDAICKATGFCGDQEEFVSIFSDIFWPIPPMIEFHARLRAQKIPTYIFSNTNELAIKRIREQFAFFSNFSDYVLSYEHGAMKPDEKLYRVVEKLTGRKGAEILYIDDRSENIETGNRLGWQTILQESPEKTLARIREIGILENR